MRSSAMKMKQQVTAKDPLDLESDETASTVEYVDVSL